VVERGRLDQLIHHAHALILPIGSGGGTSLKAAEALISSRPVISTAAGLRGFERFGNRPRVTLADNPQAFRERLAAALQAPRRPADRDVESLTWSHALSGLPRWLSAASA
jgi:glycosyltransferase involved in cell wall biosynthesis